MTKQITEFEQAEAIVGAGDANLVALARAILYHPRLEMRGLGARFVYVLASRPDAVVIASHAYR